MPTYPPKKFALDVKGIDELLSRPEASSESSEAWIDAKVDRFADELEQAGLARRERRLPPDLARLKAQIRRAQRDAAIAKTRVAHDFDGYQVSDCTTGGMGMVLRAWDPHLDREVAIKLWLEPGPEGDTDLLEEARALARRNHPNIVTVYGTGVWNGRRYFTMEWIDGSNAREWLEQTPRTWREVRELFVEAGRGLAAAHEVGIQHRDFKPSNILVGKDGRVCVADFGIADTMRSSDPLHESSTLAGTQSYIAPERIMRGKGDARSDQYSFCVALWEALHGLMPFCAPSVRELVRMIEAGVTRPIKASSSVPHWLSRVIRKGLSFDPDQRYPNMPALLTALAEDLSAPAPERAEDSVDDEGGLLSTHDYVHEPSYAREGVELIGTSPGGPDRQKIRTGLTLGVGLVGGAVTTLIAIGALDVPQPTEVEVSRATPLSQRDRALLRFDEARTFVEHGKIQNAYDAWCKGRDLLLREDPRHVGEAAMQLVEAITAHNPKRVAAAWLAVGAADAFEGASEWSRAAQAAHTAAEIYRRAGHWVEAEEYEACAAKNDAGLPCSSLLFPVSAPD